LPVLERPDRVHATRPRTPPLSDNHGIESVSGVTVVDEGGENEELEFDLGSLGLEDKEIPYERLVKKEKIGSGGFKE
jgi:mitogen-activated protein kinase kinase kinase 13